jgi:histidyl-tRNA synthetase
MHSRQKKIYISRTIVLRYHWNTDDADGADLHGFFLILLGFGRMHSKKIRANPPNPRHPRSNGIQNHSTQSIYIWGLTCLFCEKKHLFLKFYKKVSESYYICRLKNSNKTYCTKFIVSLNRYHEKMSKPGIPTGTRDFSPEQVEKRNYIFDTIRRVFQKYGFRPIETPAMEQLSTLMGKYGEEGDKLLFKILHNGDKLKDAVGYLAEGNDANPATLLSEKGLRYDLTVPFARYVVSHQNEIKFPFKRYQIQPVWRGDAPQRGRYREFYQCDADVIGSNSLLYEADLIRIYDEVFTQFGLKVVIKINNRKILFGMAEAAGIPNKFMEMTTALDKLDKIGWDGVQKELAERGIGGGAISVIQKILQVDSLAGLKKYAGLSASLEKGIEELEKFYDYFDLQPAMNEVKFDITLARGLSYYTGCIMEVKAVDVPTMGSVGGGGRYDDLTGVFGLKNISGVGISFGADRIYDCLQSLSLFPKESTAGNVKVLFVSFDDVTHRYAYKCLLEMRKSGVAAEIYPEPARLQKQMKYANDRKIPFVALIGGEEMISEIMTLRNMESGGQERVNLETAIRKLK